MTVDRRSVQFLSRVSLGGCVKWNNLSFETFDVFNTSRAEINSKSPSVFLVSFAVNWKLSLYCYWYTVVRNTESLLNRILFHFVKPPRDTLLWDSISHHPCNSEIPFLISFFVFCVNIKSFVFEITQVQSLKYRIFNRHVLHRN